MISTSAVPIVNFPSVTVTPPESAFSSRSQYPSAGVAVRVTDSPSAARLLSAVTVPFSIPELIFTPCVIRSSASPCAFTMTLKSGLSLAKFSAVPLPERPLVMTTGCPAVGAVAVVTLIRAPLSSAPVTLIVLLFGRYTLLGLLFMITGFPDMPMEPPFRLIPPPVPFEVLPVIVPPLTVRVPLLQMPPPLPGTLWPEIVPPEKVIVP